MPAAAAERWVGRLREAFPEEHVDTDPGFTLRVYRHAVRRDPESRARLAALVGAAEWAPLGTSALQSPSPASPSKPRPTKKPRISRAFEDGHGWARTSDLSRVKRALSH